MAELVVAIDTETNGLDLQHGCKPFLVTACEPNGDQQYWEWAVDPLTRKPEVPETDLKAIRQLIRRADALVLHNAKFDVHALMAVGITDWPWEKTQDTLVAGHLLASNQPHDLTSMALHYLGIDILPFEKAVEEATQAARRWCRTNRPDWRIAKDGLEDMPSSKQKTWKADMWLPRTVIKEWWETSPAGQIVLKGKGSIPSRIRSAMAEEGWEYRPTNLCDGNHPWWNVLEQYANADTSATIALWPVVKARIQKRELWPHYLERMKVIPIAWKMERNDLTINRARLEQQQCEYRRKSEEAGQLCVNIARSYGYDLQLPRSGNNQSLLDFLFGHKEYDDHGQLVSTTHYMKLPYLKCSKKTGNPSLDKQTIDQYAATLPVNSKQLAFILALRTKRERDTAIQYMEGYRRFWLKMPAVCDGCSVRTTPRLGCNKCADLSNQYRDWYVLHPNLNPTGTATLRMSSNNPNEQNISKKPGFNLRYCFGPAPGREWWSLDAKNIELRLPAYEAGETEMIQLFERPDDPPYFGSNHLLTAHVIHKKIFEECVNEKGQLDGRIFKKRYEGSWYKYTKNGNFANQYGATLESGTADRAYRVPGAQLMVMNRFKRITALNHACIEQANRFGFVETMPDRTVDPKRGYPIMCTRSEYGKVLPTVPLNYHIQSTAMWVMMRMMIKCQAYLDELNNKAGRELYRIILQVHDELVFDFPFLPDKGNLGKVMNLKALMDTVGDDLVPCVPLPVGIEYNPVTWSEGETVV